MSPLELERPDNLDPDKIKSILDLSSRDILNSAIEKSTNYAESLSKKGVTGKKITFISFDSKEKSEYALDNFRRNCYYITIQNKNEIRIGNIECFINKPLSSNDVSLTIGLVNEKQ